MIIIENRKIDVAKHNDNVIIVAKQGDTASRFLHAEILFEGAKINVPSTAQIWVNAKRADGEANAYFGTVHTDGTITVPLNHWMLDVPGYLRCDVSILDNGEKLTSLSFSVENEEATYTDEAVEEDENYDVLTSLIIQTETMKIEVKNLLEQIGELPSYVAETVEQYLSTHNIKSDNVSFDNEGTDITSNNVQEALVELAERGSTSIPSYTLYYSSSLTDAEKEHNAEIVKLITSDESNAFICTLQTYDFELSLNSLWYFDLPEFEYFDTSTNTHYKYIANKDGTVTVETNKNADPSAIQRPSVPTQSTSGAFIGQLCIVGNGKSVYVYKGPLENVHFWMQIPTMNDIPTKVSQLDNDSGFLTEHQSLSGYAKEEYVTSAISTALGSIETALEALTTGGGIE